MERERERETEVYRTGLGGFSPTHSDSDRSARGRVKEKQLKDMEKKKQKNSPNWIPKEQQEQNDKAAGQQEREPRVLRASWKMISKKSKELRDMGNSS